MSSSDALDAEIRRQQQARKEAAGEIAMLGSAKPVFDTDLYGGSDRSQFATELVDTRADNDDDDDDDDDVVDVYGVGRGVGVGGTHPATLAAAQKADRIAARMKAEAMDDTDGDGDAAIQARMEMGGSGKVNTVIADRESEYQARRRTRMLSPDRGGGGDGKARAYKDIMKEQVLEREKELLLRKAAQMEKDAAEGGGGAGAGAGAGAGSGSSGPSSRPPKTAAAMADTDESDAPTAAATQPPTKRKRRRRWDTGPTATTTATDGANSTTATPLAAATAVAAAITQSQASSSRWDQPTPANLSSGMAPTPLVGSGGSAVPATPTRKKRSRWDQTPVDLASGAAATPLVGSGGATGVLETPVLAAGGGAGAMARTVIPMTGDEASAQRWLREMESRNRPLTDDDLDAMLPAKGYVVLEPPADYRPVKNLSQRLLATPTPMAGAAGFSIPQTPAREDYGIATATPSDTGLPDIKPEDLQYFGKLLEEGDAEALSTEELKERRIMALLLKIKNGTPPQRKVAMRQITDKAREFGAGPLFGQILPLLMSHQLEDQERHLLVKVIDRVLYKLDDLVRPYVHKILVVIQPLLIDEDYYARVEGREVISNLAKAAGLATMISTMRPDIDNLDEYVRNTTARAFAVVASALGIPALLPFLKAVCGSRKSWQARHTGVKVVQQIAILMGCAVLPHLKSLIGIIAHGLQDDQQKVRTITALALAALAEAAHPYGIESFDDVIVPLWKGVQEHRGKGLAAFLKAVGFIIPLMEKDYAQYSTKEILAVIRREFQSPDEEMKKVVLKVLQQVVAADGLDAGQVITDVLPDFFKYFWVRRMALERRNSRAVVETTVELANKVGVAALLAPRNGGASAGLVDILKQESEPFRKMAMEAIDAIIKNLGAADVSPRLEETLIDGILYAFQEQATDESPALLNGFGTVVNALGTRTKPYLPQICGTIKWRLNNKSPRVRMQAADLISRIAVVMKTCGEEQKLGHLGVVLYECLGEEYPDVLGSILGGLKAIVNVIGMTNMQPPIKDLLPRLTPIMKNRHEKVQEQTVDLVGRIADRGAEMVAPREWMRICFELLELLKAHKKAIRRASVNTFGYIAKAIGPQDVLHTLLNNLKVQERQNRVCTTIAIAIVAETCQPFTVLPALLNEYRVPEMNVQNGVLKALSFLFEYIGEMGKDYLGACVPLLEDALTDRDMVHRQTACATIRHMALGAVGLSCEDELGHLLNFVWPNIFETSPHVIQAVMEAVEGLRCALGPYRILNYVLQGLFHPARRVRDVYWRLWNNLYVYAQDSLTPFYPRVEDDQHNSYTRTYLELML